ncbi:UPF0182 family protein [Actinotalea sp. K2]|uniref:UPF0182 family membrane protein n=1 Tax=Actinotalea sp. K2 TaxID=2939438 RepID=UPI002016AF7F|nr:UPF0182 family protein [Actinotalea sp. K2]MCL3859845.1 UPF0182 family protein [Actinotalea sp. K2]
MTFAPSPRPAAGAPSPARRRGALGPTLIVLAALGVLLLITAQVWTEVLWYSQLGFLEVLRTEWVTRGLLFVIGFLLMATAVGVSLNVGYRTRPIYAPSTPEQASLDQYREMIEPLRRLVMIAGPALLGFFAGAAASAQWTTVQLYLNQVEFGVLDPQYGMDLSFFIFTLPAVRFVVSFLMAVVVIAGIAGAATQYLYGGLRLGGGGERTTRAARVQLGVVAALVMLLIAANYWLDRYSLLTKSGERFEGASYSDINAVLPSRVILTVIAIIVAGLFLVAALRGTWRLPAAGVAVMVVSAIAIGGIYPAVVQRFQVDPNAQTLEAEFIQRNIDATKAAFGLEDVEITTYNAALEPEEGGLRADAETAASIRLLDPAIISPSFRQLQQNKQYYNFADTLAVDRYEIEGESRDTVIAVRELNLAGLGADQRSWINDHTVFTHGFGVVAAYGNTTAADGRPAFYQGGIPSTGSLGDYEPRIYFGQSTPEYSIVGAPEGAEPWELDFPDDDAGGQVNTTFPTQDVAAGPSIGSTWNKLLYAIKFGSEQIMFSDRVTEDSQILYDRDPRDRVAKVAPFLTLDTRVYPAVVDERVVWIVDGYTTSDAYPYSASRPLEDITTDSLTTQSDVIAALAPQQVNYLRNSVKATVDAYSGEVTLYAWDDEDPILQAWTSVFPNIVSPMSEISGDLMSHLRYPEDLFKVQRNLLSRYHVDNASDFYSGQDFWANPNDPVNNERGPQPPYYLTLRMPTQDEPTFSLTSTFIPGGNTDRNVLTGFLAVDAEPGNGEGERREGYGQLRLLELPRNATVPGPGQVNNNFRSNPEVSESLNVLGLGNSTVVPGNLLTLPVGGGLLYVQPVYVQSSTGTQFPLLQRVLVSFGEEIGFANTLDEALDQVFGGDAGVGEVGPGDDVEVVPDLPLDPLPGEGDPPPAPTTAPEPTDEPEVDEPTTPTVPGDARARLSAALDDAREAIADGQDALSAGDFAAYGDAQERLQTALEAAIAAEAELAG